MQSKADKIVPPLIKPASLTKPMPFSFATDSRVKSEIGKVVQSSENVDFLKMLRTYKSGPSKVNFYKLFIC